ATSAPAPKLSMFGSAAVQALGLPSFWHIRPGRVLWLSVYLLLPRRLPHSVSPRTRSHRPFCCRRLHHVYPHVPAPVLSLREWPNPASYRRCSARRPSKSQNQVFLSRCYLFSFSNKRSLSAWSLCCSAFTASVSFPRLSQARATYQAASDRNTD